MSLYPRPSRQTHSWIPAATLLVLVAGSILTFAQGRQLQMVSTAWPPFTNAPGQPRFALDLVEAALGRAGIGITTTLVPPADFTRSLIGSRFDGSAAAWKDAERERLLLFSQPYLENRLILVGRRGADVSAGSLSALRGKTVAIVEGYSYGDAAENAGPTYVRSSSEEDSLRRLLASEVQYALMDELVVQYITSNYADQASTRLAFGASSLITQPLYLAVRRELPDADSIITRFNAQLRGMIADRTYHRLLHVDWITADVDGDGVPENVPSSDRLGVAEPRRSYSLSTTPGSPETSTSQRFMVGGSIYNNWASVPESYKVIDPNNQDPRRATASLFRFTW